MTHKEITEVTRRRRFAGYAPGVAPTTHFNISVFFPAKWTSPWRIKEQLRRNVCWWRWRWWWWGWTLCSDRQDLTASRSAGHSSLANTVSSQFSTVNLFVFVPSSCFVPLYCSILNLCFLRHTPRWTGAFQWSTLLYQKSWVKVWWNENNLFWYLWWCTFFLHNI